MNLARDTSYNEKLSSLIQGKVLLVGYGIENRSVYNFLKTVAPEIEIAIADQKQIENAPANVKTYCGTDYLRAFASYETLVRAPGVSPSILPKGKKIVTATQLFFALHKKPTIGVTGTKGKSTTTSLIYYLLKEAGISAQLLGNIGIPILEGLPEKTDVSVIELSSFHLEDLTVSPDIAVLLDIAPEHLDHHGSLEGYSAAKLHIAKFQSPESKLIAHLHHKNRSDLGAASTKIFFNETPASGSRYKVISDSIVDSLTSESLCTVDELPLVGSGNLQNVIAALEVAAQFRIPNSVLRKGLLSFAPLPHRLELVGTFKGITFYNDSLCTVPEALRNAVNAFGAKTQTVIVGGYDRGISFKIAGDAIADSSVENVIYFPTTGEKILHHTLNAAKKPIVSIPVYTMKDAVQQAYNLTSSGKICLLSPASPSFSVFKDYADRGNQFKDWVKNLSN